LPGCVLGLFVPAARVGCVKFWLGDLERLSEGFKVGWWDKVAGVCRYWYGEGLCVGGGKSFLEKRALIGDWGREGLREGWVVLGKL